MATDWQTLEGLAHDLAPPGAQLTHLCSGGLSTTFEVAPRVGGRYALKVIEHLPEGYGRTDGELDALLRVSNPHLAPYLGRGMVSRGAVSYRWVTMGFVEGVPLRTHRDRVPALASTISLLREAIVGASALWTAGIAHRDLTPDNMIVTSTSGLVIVDLGMPRLLDHAQPGGTITSGTPGWMSPEQVTSAPGDWRSDQYVLGLLGHWLLTGTESSTNAPSMETRGFEVADLGHGVPGPLAEVIATMLSPDPDDRWQDPDALLAAIDLAVGRLTSDQMTIAALPGLRHTGAVACSQATPPNA